MKQRKVSLEKVVLNCEKEYSRREEIHRSGCRDPCRNDGCNLNLVPNHIISYKKQIESYCAERSVERPPFLLRECLRAAKKSVGDDETNNAAGGWNTCLYTRCIGESQYAASGNLPADLIRYSVISWRKRRMTHSCARSDSCLGRHECLLTFMHLIRMRTEWRGRISWRKGK